MKIWRYLWRIWIVVTLLWLGIAGTAIADRTIGNFKILFGQYDRSNPLARLPFCPFSCDYVPVFVTDSVAMMLVFTIGYVLIPPVAVLIAGFAGMRIARGTSGGTHSDDT